MRDFDFDELDRAVSSALGGQDGQSAVVGEGRSSSPTPAAARAQSAAPERSVRSEAPLEVPERESRGSEDTPKGSVPERAASPRPRTGRFMDVVHPSTDMRQTTPLSEVTLAREVPETPEEKSVPPVRQEVPMNDVKVVARSEVTDASELRAATHSDTPEEPWEPPVDSPFLPDAKVEKRPLGGSQPAAAMNVQVEPQAEEAPLSSLDTLLDFDNDAPNPEMEAVHPTAPEDVEGATNETDNLESKGNSIAPAPQEKSYEDVSAQQMVDIEAESVPEFDAVEQSTPEPQSAAHSTPVSMATPAPAEPSEYTGPVAITPQYTSKPSSNQESGEIFDTESYHQPFAAPPKKSNSALKVTLIILLILLLGAGAGAGIYFFVLPML